MATWHVIPMNDDESHTQCASCKCEPRVEWQENGNVIIIHNSFDGREGVEWANEILKNEERN